MSATPEPRVAVEVLIGALRRAVEATSTHQVAKSVGLSQGGVRKLLAGSEPQPATVLKLTAWYVRDAANAHRVNGATADAALTLLVDALPPDERERAKAALRRLLREEHRRTGARQPPWLND